MSFQDITNFYIRQDLTGDDLVKLTGKQPIVYSQLKNYTSVEQLLGKEGFVVILYETSSRTSGHWTSLSITFEGKLRFCDSYGLYPDDEDQYASTNALLPKYLTALINKSTLNFEYNQVDYQRKSSSVSTCGRYAAFFSTTAREMTLAEVKAFLTGNASSILNPDFIVTAYTMHTLREIRGYFEKNK
jgi:hypothetical protein